MRFLIVEDEFVSRWVLQEYLKGLGDVDIAANGNEALLAFNMSRENKKPYDLICLDIMMPEVDGYGVLKEIRGIEKNDNIEPDDKVKVLITTALANDYIVKAAMNNGADAYLYKPIQKESLIPTLRRLKVL